MSEQLSLEEARNGQSLLMELLQEVSIEEGTLSGGIERNTTLNELLRLREAAVKLGNPRNHLIRLTSKLFESIGFELSDVYKHQMRNQFDFYYMTQTISLQSAVGIPFRQLEFTLDFGPKGGNEPIIQSIFPKREWKEKLRLGAGFSLSINSDMQLRAEVNTPIGLNIAQLQTTVGGTGKANAFVTIPESTFKLGQVEITARGEGNSNCYWRIEQSRLREVQDVQFLIVFKVPKGTRSIELDGLAASEPSSLWIADHTQDAFEHLSNKFRMMLRRGVSGQSGRDRFLIYASEHWLIALPD